MMPILKLPNGSGGLDPLARMDILAVMLFPSDAEARRIWRRVEQIQAWREIIQEYGNNKILIPLEVVETLLQAVEAPELFKDRMHRATWQGAVAGDFLQLIASISHQGSRGSVRQAEHVLLTMDYEPGQTLGGQNVPRNSYQLRKAWAAYKPVAHLWAAYRHVHILQNAPAYDRAGLLLAKKAP